MDKTTNCIDCGKDISNMKKGAKRCKECRRKYQDQRSYDIKKRNRIIERKQKVESKANALGIIPEIKAKRDREIRKVIEEKTKVDDDWFSDIKNKQTNKTSDVDYLTYYGIYPPIKKKVFKDLKELFPDWDLENLKRFVDESIEKKVKGEIRKNREKY